MTLILFSSNLRPLYEQDIIDLAAAPKGHVKRFRYESKHVALALRNDWAAIKGKDVLVVYTIKQPDDYHDPAYVPVRYGTVTDAFHEGSVYVVEFCAAGYAPLGHADPDVWGAHGKKVRDFTESLSATLKGVGHPGADDHLQRFYVVEAPVPPNLISTKNDADDFEHLVPYLSKTVSFSTHVFWRVLGIREAGTSNYPDADASGRFKLKVDTSYDLVIVHRQLRESGGAARFKIQTDKSLVDVIGADYFEINSRYDSIPIRLRVPMRSDTKETVIQIAPAEGVKGPRCDVRVVVGPNNAQAVVGAALAVSLPVVVGIPTLLGNDAPRWVRILFTLLGALIAFLTLLRSPWRK